jgi:sarcosine oxidase subunit alpha
MSQPMRTPQGGRIDRSKPITFRFDGRLIEGCEGDTLASALLANGIHLVGRSFKYHRPRGILAAGCEEPNALAEVTRGPGRFDTNERLTTVPAVDGLVVESQNRWPSLRWDLGAVNNLVSPLIPSGFYYKTFMWPRSFWHRVYEPGIRRIAGLGRAPDSPDPDGYAQAWAHCDLLVIGGGPAGLAAALAAAPSGRRVILCDADEEMGGSLLLDPGAVVDGLPAWQWISRSISELSRHANVRMLPRTTAFSYGVHNMVALAERLTDHLPAALARGSRERQWLVRAGEVVIATGAIERPLIFPNNDRPGIMLASAARSFVNRYGVLPGKRALVCVAHDSGYRAAFDLADAGGTVAAIVDLRAEVAQNLAQEAAARGIEVLVGQAPADSRGRLRVQGVSVGRINNGSVEDTGRWLACDLVLMAGGWTPSVHLFSQSRGQVAWDEAAQAFLPRLSVQAERSVGACGGSLSLSSCLVEGWQAGLDTVGGSGAAPSGKDRDDAGCSLADLPQPDQGAKSFIDFQNDVAAADIALAVREGFRSVEHIKRYTTTGMATDQGRTSNINALIAAAQALGKAIPAVGLTTFRAPYTPTTFGTLAGYNRGPLFEPVRRTPTHAWAEATGAVFEDVGQWKRARYFPKSGEDMDAAVARECRTARVSAGMVDASTLGKIEVVGPDAQAFLDFLYINDLSTLAVGRCRYAVMLREDGFVVDDGVIARLAPDRFHVTTTTGGAANVLHMMEDYRQTEFPHMKVWLTSTTEQWAVIAISGPRTRDIIEPLVAGVDLSTRALPHMAVCEGRICGVPLRLLRVSFTGELGYEINVPSSYGGMVWEAVHAAGAAYNIAPYGTEALHVLRAERGHFIVGQDSDGTVTAADLGLERMVGDKPDFVGKRSLERAAMRDPQRRQMVGLLTSDGRTLLEEGAQVVERRTPDRSLGHVTSAYSSPAAGRPIALALIHNGRARIGGKLQVPMPDGAVAVEVVQPLFLDLKGASLHD